MNVEKLESTLGVRITGVRVTDLSHSHWDRIRSLFVEHALLVFPGQHLTGAEQAAFGARFGPLEELFGSRSGVLPITNLARDGKGVRSADDPVLRVIKGNEGWHSDSSFKEVSAKASLLSAHVVPSSGGETEIADMRAAYDALDPSLVHQVEQLSARHSFAYSQSRVGDHRNDWQQGGVDDAAPVRPLVKVHPESGRRSLFIGRHAFGIPGLEPEESERLLDSLIDFAARPPRVYTHHWSVGDLVIWDNRCTVHRVRNWELREPRLMIHTRVAGDPTTEAASAPT